MRRLYLHIGSPKTGTTSIQNTFHANRDALHTQGFRYPGDKSCHHLLSFLMKREESAWPRQFKGIDKERLQKVVTNFLLKVSKDFLGHDDHFIISNEHFFVSDRLAIKNCVDWLKEYVADIEVIVFVRDPVEQYASQQQQVIKANHHLVSPNEFYYGFREVIEGWGEFCKVHVMQFDSSEDSVNKMSSQIGLDPKALIRDEEKVNESVSLEQMLLLEKVQRDVYPNMPDTFKNHLSPITQFRGGSQTKPRLKDDAVSIVSRKHKEDVRWINNEYGLDFYMRTDSGDASTCFPTECKVSDVFDLSNSKYSRYESLLIDALLKHVAQK